MPAGWCLRSSSWRDSQNLRPRQNAPARTSVVARLRSRVGNAKRCSLAVDSETVREEGNEHVRLDALRILMEGYVETGAVATVCYGVLQFDL